MYDCEVMVVMAACCETNFMVTDCCVWVNVRRLLVLMLLLLQAVSLFVTPRKVIE